MKFITSLGLIFLATTVLCANVDIAWNLPSHLTNTIAVGDTVTWITSDGLTHTITSNDGTSLLASPSIMAGGSGSADRFSHTFDTAGNFTYFCSIHGAGQMSGLLIVEAATNQSGVNITALPILPVLECVDHNSDGSLTAYFGYWNPNQENITIPVGELNNVLGGDLAEVESFEPGRQTRVFSSTGDAASNITWTVTSGNVQNAAVATANSRNCSTLDVAPPGDVIPVLNCSVVSGNTITVFMNYLNTGFDPITINGSEANSVRFTNPTLDQTVFPDITTFNPGEGIAFNATMPIDTTMVWTIVNSYSGTSRSVKVNAQNAPSCAACSTGTPTSV